MITEKDYKRRLVRVWFFGFVGLLIILGTTNWMRFYRLTRDGVPAQLTVRSVKTGLSAAIEYSYVVNGTSYEGDGQGGFGNPPLEQVKPGDVLRGTYEREDPAISCLGDPAPQLARQSVLTLLAAIFFPTFIVLRGWRKYRKWAATQPGAGPNPA